MLGLRIPNTQRNHCERDREGTPISGNKIITQPSQIEKKKNKYSNEAGRSKYECNKTLFTNS